MSLFSGKQAGTTSANVNNGMLTTALAPVVGAAGSATSQVSDLLSGGFEGYKKNAGFDWASKEGSKGILGNAAARGLLRSGSTGKALVNYGNNMANQNFGDYVSKLLGLGQLGLGGAGVLASAGQTSSSTQGKPGLGGILTGKLLGA